MEKGTKFIRQIQSMAKEKSFRETHVKNAQKDFIRTRKMTFQDTIMCTIGNTKGPLALETEKFCRKLDRGTISAAAVCKARQKIKYTAFKELFEKTAANIERDKKFCGYRIIAFDGMKGELPRTPEFTEKYKFSSRADAPIFHAILAYDVLNKVFIMSEFNFGGASEHRAALNLLEEIKKHEVYKREPQIWLYDRGFPSLKLLKKLVQHNQKYVMRVPKSFLKEIKEFQKSEYMDKTVHVKYDEKRKAANRVDFDGEIEFDVRCIRVKLKNGEEEILITNLERKIFTKQNISMLYQLRWGIETSFNYLKHSIFIEEFTSRSENGIFQDFYVSLLVYNFVSCLCGFQDEDNSLKKQNIRTK